jgi:hypothetical protein
VGAGVVPMCAAGGQEAAFDAEDGDCMISKGAPLSVRLLFLSSYTPHRVSRLIPCATALDKMVEAVMVIRSSVLEILWASSPPIRPSHARYPFRPAR